MLSYLFEYLPTIRPVLIRDGDLPPCPFQNISAGPGVGFSAVSTFPPAVTVIVIVMAVMTEVAVADADAVATAASVEVTGQRKLLNPQCTFRSPVFFNQTANTTCIVLPKSMSLLPVHPLLSWIPELYLSLSPTSVSLLLFDYSYLFPR